MKSKASIVLLFSLYSFCCVGQDERIALWPGGIPYANDHVEEIHENPKIGRVIQKVHVPEIAVYHAPEHLATGTGVLVCPGGGYYLLAWDWEGVKIAKWLNSIGVSAFVLKYRLPHWEDDQARSRVALQDAQRAMKVIRMNAKRWNLDSQKIGVMGFSAGGHLASTLSNRWDLGLQDSYAEVEQYPCRPDFAILVYPVISMMPEITHGGSRDNLITPEASPNMVHYFSNEFHVTEETPPTVLIHATDDEGVLPENSIRYFRALREKGISAALHLYESGGHGFGIDAKNLSVAHWPENINHWLVNAGLLDKKYRVLLVQDQISAYVESGLPDLNPLLEESDAFLLDRVFVPQLNAEMDMFQPDFSWYDAVIMHCQGPEWPLPTKKALEDYVGNGGGLVVTARSSSAYPGWSEFLKMKGIMSIPPTLEKGILRLSDRGELISGLAEDNLISQSLTHDFQVEVLQKEHPIMTGLPSSWIQKKDVISTAFTGPALNLNILAKADSERSFEGSGLPEPVIMTINYGHGRVFHTTLGNSPEAYRNEIFKHIFTRGVEWSITGSIEKTIAAPAAEPKAGHLDSSN